MSEEKTIQLKVDEEAVNKEEEEEVEQEEAEGNEEEEQKDENQEQNEGNENQEQNENQNKIELKQEDDDEEEAADVEENNNNSIVLQDVKKNKDEYYLSNEIKVNVEWFIDDNENVDILFCTNTQQKLVLHWGVSNANSQGKWSHIDSLCYPPLSKDFDDFAIQTDFSYLEGDNTQQKIRIKFPKDDVSSLNFVFLERDSNRWYNNGKKDYHINLN
jgi:hypothetical protein